MSWSKSCPKAFTTCVIFLESGFLGTSLNFTLTTLGLGRELPPLRLSTPINFSNKQSVVLITNTNYYYITNLGWNIVV